MNFEAYYEERTSSLTYLVWHESSLDAVVIDSVLDYDPASSKYTSAPLAKPIKKIAELGLKLHYIIESHAHADHLSGAQELKRLFPKAKTLIGAGITSVQRKFKEIYNLDDSFKTDGSQFDRLAKDGETISAGELEIKAIFTPGHTNACCCYHIDNALFVGDVLFMPDYGVARCDFPEGSAKNLFLSVTEKIYCLPDETLVMTAHDYMPGGRPMAYQSTIGDQKENNIYITAATSEADFVQKRNARDKELPVPRLLLPSVQVNINAGILPNPENNGVSYLKIPLAPKL